MFESNVIPIRLTLCKSACLITGFTPCSTKTQHWYNNIMLNVQIG